ncbi:RHS repeat domain-containing protein [Fimbriiglobus ruber]|uniref:Alkaline phosphatase n=1 Tax=Fimbriiglobus ruber TaxID=1908690 RepID=A0A225D138_9BACT|nr:Ig-like domain-containing protein [Fimbriiglobus ruber]OWK35320.1 Alkaline phosphatase [Fimbriiglobus ruber]
MPASPSQSHAPRGPRPGRRWYRFDLFAALDRLRTFYHRLTRTGIDALVRPVKARPELTALETRMMPARPLPDPIIVTGSGVGASPTVNVYNAATGALNYQVTPYAATFTGGVRVASADFNLDGNPDVVVAPGPGGGPEIRILDGQTGEQIAGPLGNYWAFDPSFTGGVSVAVADVTGKGYPDVIVAAGSGGGPRVRVFDGRTGAVIDDFFAYDPSFRGGISVAAADFAGLGRAQIAVGAGPGEGPVVKVYDALTQTTIAGPLGTFFAFDPASRSGVTVGADATAGDVNGDGVPDLAVGSGPGVPAEVKVFSGADGSVLWDLSPFGSSFTGGVTAALAYVDDDADADVVVGSGPGIAGEVKVFSGATGLQLADPLGDYVPYGTGATGGLFVAAANDPDSMTVDVTLAPQIASVGTPVEALVTVTSSGAIPTLDWTVYWGDGTTTTDSETVGGATTATFTEYHTYTAAGTYIVEADVSSVSTFSLGGGFTGTFIHGFGSGTATETINQAPTITGFTPDTGYSSTDGITDATTLTIFGTAGDDSGVSLYDGTTAIGSTTASSGGLWTITYGTLADGVHPFVAAVTVTGTVAYDAADRSAAYPVTVDTTPPVVAIRAPSETYDTAPPITVTAVDPLPGGFPPTATVTLDIDGSAAAAAALVDGTATFTGYGSLTVGDTYTLQAQVTDAAGNVGTSPSASVTVNPWTTDASPVDLVSPVESTPPSQPAAGGNVAATVPLVGGLGMPAVAGQAPALAYNSSGVQLQPPIQVSFQSPNDLSAPSDVIGTLTWDGTAEPATTFPGTGLRPGADWTFGFVPPSSATGRHTYSVSLFIDYGSPSLDVTTSVPGSTFVVDQTGSPFGAGWTLSTTDQLVAVAAAGSLPAGEMLVEGTGGWEFFAVDGSGYDSPPGDPGTLAAVAGGFTYTSITGEVWAFNSSGQMTSWTAADGGSLVTFGYDGSSRLSTMAAPDGGVSTFSYDGGGLIDAIASPGGRVTTLTHSGTNLTGVTDPAGGTATLAYDGSHHLLTIADGVELTTYTYSNGMAATVQTAGGTTTVAPALGAGRAGATNGAPTGSVTDPTGAATQTAFNALGEPVDQVDPTGGESTVTRDSNGYILTQVDADGNTTTYTRDAAGFPLTMTDPLGGVTTYTYQVAYHALTSETDPLGHTTTYTYTAAGDLQTVTDPLGDVTTYTWAAGLVQTTTDPLGRVVTDVYDAARHLIGQLSGGIPTGTAVYDADGYPASTVDALGDTTTVVNDADGRPVTTTTPDGATTTVVYDVSGLALSSKAPDGVTTSYAYNTAGLVTASIVGFGSGLAQTTTTVYDAADRPVASIDPLGNITTTTYDAAGRVLAVTDPLGDVSTTSYDPAGNVTATEDPLGRVTRTAYDADNRPVTVTDPLGDTTTATYDAAGTRSPLPTPGGTRRRPCTTPTTGPSPPSTRSGTRRPRRTTRPGRRSPSPTPAGA